MKPIATILALILAVALGVAAGRELSAEAAAVVIGVVCGVAAGIPTAVLLLVALARRDRRRTEESGLYTEYPPQQRGPVIIVGRPARGQATRMQAAYASETEIHELVARLRNGSRPPQLPARGPRCTR